MKKGLFCVSYVEHDVLHVALIESVSGALHLLARGEFSMTKDHMQSGLEEMKKHLDRYQQPDVQWIHLILRHVAFVKVFELPNVAESEREKSLKDKMQAEVPYHPHEVMLHTIFQGRKSSALHPAIAYGISKKILNEQLKRLESLGIFPDQIMLSTEVLMRLFQSKMETEKNLSGASLLVCLFANRVELLFFESEALLHSRSFPHDPGEGEGLKEIIEDGTVNFLREWRRRPANVFFLGDLNVEPRSLMQDEGVAVKHIALEADLLRRLRAGRVQEQTSGDQLEPIEIGAIDVYLDRTVFDFNPQETRQRSDQAQREKHWARFASSIVGMSAAFFLYSLIHVGSVTAEIGWIRWRSAQLSDSVREVKQMRSKVLDVRHDQDRKAAPAFLLAALRQAIPESLLLERVDFDFDRQSIVVDGYASQQSQIDRFANDLKATQGIQNVELIRVQSKESRPGKTAEDDLGRYDFSLEVHL
ncbi:MAG: PilN domain-containing protein [Candidatus Omnitrophica bacterium]|nr:PilN domain-containing protein [Candidatus Omnitrophota bacterium]